MGSEAMRSHSIHFQRLRATVGLKRPTPISSSAAAPLLRDVHFEVPTSEVLSIERCDGRVRGRSLLHLDETEPPWATRLPISNQIHAQDRSVLAKERSEFVLRRGKGQVSDVQTLSQFRTLAKTPGLACPSDRLDECDRSAVAVHR